MKRKLSLLLVCVMCLTISACSKDNNSFSEVSKETSAIETISEVSDEEYVVPDLIGKTQDEAFEILHNVGLEGQVYFDFDSPDDNPVKSQNIEPGTKLSKDAVVGFYIGDDENYFSHSGDINKVEATYKLPSKIMLYIDKRDGSDIESCTKIEWDFSNNRIATNSELYDSEAKDEYRSESEYFSLEYNDDGMISKVTSENDANQHTSYFYDEENNVCQVDKSYIEYSGNERTYVTTDGTVTERFDDNGNRVFKEILDERFDDGMATYEYKYDKYNNIIGDSNFDVNIKDIKYDENKIIEGTIYSEDWKYVNNAKIEYKYDYEYDYPSSIIIDNNEDVITIDIEYRDISEEKYKSLIEIYDIEWDKSDFNMIKIGESEWFSVYPFYNFFKPVN